MPLNDDHLRAIGRIVVTFNYLEESAEFTVQALMGDSTPNIVWQALTVGESFDRLIFKIGVLARLRLPYPDLLADLERWITEAKKVQEDRNRVLHSGWISWQDQEHAEDVATALRQTSRDIFGQITDYTPRDLHAIADRIAEVEKSLRTLRRRMRDLPMRS